MAPDPLEHPDEAIRRLYGYVSYRIGPGVDAEDVVSATVERALKYRGSYNPRHGTPSAWLTGIANRCIADHLEARGRQELYGLQAPESYAAELTARSDVSPDLAGALAALDDRARELIALRYGADLTSKEIGRILDLKPGAVDVALHRALSRLRELLDTGAQGRQTGF
jgi:RNA polymerase sigma-70 factor (ECF subfamily)